MGTSKSFRIKGIGLRRRMDGWMGVLFIVYSISLSLCFGGITQRERSMLVGSGCVGGSAFYFPSFPFSVFRFPFFVFRFSFFFQILCIFNFESPLT